MGELPGGTVTFLFSDIEGSTHLLHELGDGAYVDVLAQHRHVLRTAFAAHNGIEIETEGDAFFVVFALASEAVAAAVEAQRGLEGGRVRVRMGLHAGEPMLTGEGYVGMVVHRAARISAVAHGGQVLLSEAVTKLADDRLPMGVGLRDLGHVWLKDLTKPEHVYQVLHPQLRENFPALRSLDATPNNLPQQITSFVGREQALAEVRRLLGNTRFVTLVGVGGLGKTRLGLQVGAEVLDDYADGVWFVELAPLSDARLVPQAVASVLEVKEEPGRPLQEALAKFVRDRQLLLILDNCEHLAHACAELAKALLGSGPQVKVLASSRELLHVVGETIYPLSALAVPDPKQGLPLAALTHYGAVHLFSDRALAARPAFQVTRENAAAIADICHRLDGIPLALELAAARVRTMSIETIAERLSDRFHLLTGGDATSLPRQQTLRACIDWSYDLLIEPERAVLVRLAVFAGGWTLQAAEEVATGGEVDKPGVLDHLTRLVEKSLVEFEPESGRYRLLETVRQYATERLVERGEGEAVRERHRDYFLGLAERAAAVDVFGENLRRWSRQLQLESENLRTALKWSIDESTETQPALRLCGALRSFWWRWGRAGEGRDWCDRALRCASRAEPTKPLLEVLIASGMMQYAIGDLTAATSAYERALALSRELNATALEGVALRLMANVKSSLGQTEDAQSLYHQSIAIHQRLGELSLEATGLTSLTSLLINEGRLAAAEEPLERALMLSQHLGDPELEAYNVCRLGSVAQYRSDYALANIRHERALAIARDLGLRELELEELRHLGEVAVGCGEFEKARILFRESLALSRGQDSWYAIRDCIDAIVALATAMKSFEVATKLSSAVDCLRRNMAAPRFPIDQERFEANQMQCRAELGCGRYESAIAAGRTLQPNDTVAAAMEWLEQG